jgi:predicted TPR repeat methyltransferase
VRSSAFEVASTLSGPRPRDLALGHGVARRAALVTRGDHEAPAAEREAAAAPLRPPFTALADVYDAIMQDVPYEAWCEFVLREAILRGWRGTTLLDVGCGTGLATEPMLRRGYEVTAVDASAAMAARARTRCPGATVLVADVRELALPAPVDLAYAVFDVLNNLVADGDLARALASVHAQLVPGGWFAFDANTTEGLRALWEDDVAEGWVDGVHYRWRHTWDESSRRAHVEAYCRTAGGAFVERHVERPFDPDELETAMTTAGFERVEVITYPTGRRADPDTPRVWVFGRRPSP